MFAEVDTQAATSHFAWSFSLNNKRVVEILQDLVAIPSVNPVYDSTSPGEAAVADHVERWAAELGLETTRLAALPGRENVLVRLMGPDAAPVLLFEAHMDTVGVDGMPDAFKPTVRDGRMYGRGTCDTKGSLAAMMAAIESLVADRSALTCTVELLAAVDEETSGKGAFAHVASGGTADAAIVGEPTACRIVHEHNGCVRGEIEVIGKAAHTSVAGEGLNAIEGMAEVIRALRVVNEVLGSRPGGAPEHGSLTVSLISGGTGINVVPERCVVNYDRRITPGQTPDEALAEIDAALKQVSRARPEFRIERPEPWLVNGSLATLPDAGIVITATSACDALGLNSALKRVPYGSDASKFAADGIPTIVFGPGSIAQAHAVDEFVLVEDLVMATRFYREMALRFGTNAVAGK